ncbi:helix-turn-helix transcriptional regulator [Prevotella sp. PINT]|jgi:Helix-turn-helix.|uniref:helix-turn-helix transcriptional regulator n=1 Tax=Bacteroidales TaxID=171549 RepID=UPI001557B1A2|nr:MULTISPECIES: helix-turn-helix transcriptional regulator [Bacteroidales]NPD83036.1 helix-turn-helix transcriptional regulator [Palleniella intestinalis]
MEIDVKPVHIGHEIDRRRIELGLSKSEFGRQIGVPQQHVNRILERETMETNKLLKVCQVLDFNFFALFCSMSHKISAYLAAVTLNGNANNNIGDSELATQLSKEQATTDSLKATISLLREHIDSLNTQINRLDSNLKDKDVIIELLKERK